MKLSSTGLLFYLAAVISTGSGLMGTSLVDAGQATAKKSEHAVDIMIDGELFTTFNFSPEQNKPYFHPVYAAGKTLVVREEVFNAEGQNSKKDNLDHFHHKGVWVAIDSINAEKLNYWHEDHKIRTVDVDVEQLDENVVLTVENHWLDDAEQPLLKETTEYTITPDRLIVCQLELTPVDKSVTFGDTKEGLFAVRVEKGMRERAGGLIRTANGDETEANSWGKPAAWVDYTGKVDGKQVGITLFDHPQNFRPSRYHVRGYGLFSINPFGESTYSKGQQQAEPITIKPGESIKLRYGLSVHSGAQSPEDIGDTYKEFLSIQ